MTIKSSSANAGIRHRRLKSALVLSSALAFASSAHAQIMWEVVEDLDGSGVTITKTGQFTTDMTGVLSPSGALFATAGTFVDPANTPRVGYRQEPDRYYRIFNGTTTPFGDLTINLSDFDSVSSNTQIFATINAEILWPDELGPTLTVAESAAISIELRKDTGTITDLFGPAYSRFSPSQNLVVQGSNSIGISFVPEPSSALLVGLGSLGLLARRKR